MLLLIPRYGPVRVVPRPRYGLVRVVPRPRYELVRVVHVDIKIPFSTRKYVIFDDYYNVKKFHLAIS